MTSLIRLWSSSFELTVGEISRYRIQFDSTKHSPSTAWPPSNLIVKITNETPILYRGAVLSGPYNISASCIETEHARRLKLHPDNLFTPNLKPVIKCGETWQSKLIVPSNGIGDWTIDVLCEILFSSNKVKYNVCIFACVPEEATVIDELQIFDGKAVVSQDGTTTTYSSSIKYEFLKPHDIFKMPDLTTFSTRDIHLVVLTHGIHGSMLDELYLKEALEEKYMDRKTDRIIFFMSDVNHSGTEDGIEICGKRLAKELLKYVGWPWGPNNNDRDNISSTSDSRNEPLISKISLIGHSLGGLINAFMAGYLHSVTNGAFFNDVQPIHFITIATPWLGSTDLSWYIKAGLKFGVVGQTGKDLALIARSTEEQENAKGAVKEDTREQPLLLALAQLMSPSHIAVSKFRNRTLYANIANDLVVSFQTSSLYFHKYDDKLSFKCTINDQLRHVFVSLSPLDITSDYISRSIKGSSPIVYDVMVKPEDVSPPKVGVDMSMEEQIAREWHKDMSWRKVFVQLEGEAHTHVIVRRKWLNAAGWQVIEHLVNGHDF
ncbi:6470_t:CDS:1 [Cetraspora pellucida]|uniref:6470_t:CDS:1 n=1 Tax=Cetraspora pellucida TaxID=1433469 RepID=A0A9N9C1M8_9GLOM|nr:6470_t:CDS:1 [Cetraspora pellucida]